MPARSFVPFLVLAAGVLAVASSSVLIRLAQQLTIPSTTISAGRLGLAALILLPLALTKSRGEIRALTGRQIGLGLVAGFFLAIHFLAWISSLEYTSVASSVALVATNPLWVGLASVVFFRERLSGPMITGVMLTVTGSALIALSDSGGSAATNALFGDTLAVVGAIAVSAYLLIGRDLRRGMNILLYIWLVYSSAAVLLVIIAIAAEYARGGSIATVFALPSVGWLLLLGLAVGPQLLGHTSFNWALRYISATFIAVAVLGEPICSALLAFVFFREGFQPIQLAGFAALLFGIAVAARAERSAPSKPHIQRQRPASTVE